jgi:hypothetical protein
MFIMPHHAALMLGSLLLSSHHMLQNIPVADAKPEDIQDLLGGALFKALYKWFTESGPVYLLPTGGLLLLLWFYEAM